MEAGRPLVRRYVLPKWGRLDAASIKKADVKALRRKIAAPILANQVMAFGLGRLQLWSRGGRPRHQPLPRHRQESRKSCERTLADPEVPVVFPLLTPGAKIILLTGARPGEVAAMRREHIQGSWWTQPGEPVPALGWPGTKNGITHRVFLTETVLALVDEHLSQKAPAADAVMRRICSELKIERCTEFTTCGEVF